MQEPVKPILDATIVLSPACMSGENKNQDRARWFRDRHVAVVCDGVTSSPHSHEAAELVTAFSPILFTGSVADRMHCLADTLYAHRAESAYQSFAYPSDTPPGMEDMWKTVLHEQMVNAYQTTLVAACFEPDEAFTRADIVVCGDSALFARDPAGNLIFSSLDTRETPTVSRHRTTIRLGPYDDLIVRVLGDATRAYHELENRNIRLVNPEQWLVCRPIGLCKPRHRMASGRRDRGLQLLPGDLLLIPRQCIRRFAQNRTTAYRIAPFCEQICIFRPEQPSVSTETSARGTNTTFVLPDHVAGGRWSHITERFPAGSDFVLASDGFYSTFEHPLDVFRWIETHRHELEYAEQQHALLRDRHTLLQNMRGDDDMTFIWIRPSAATTNPDATRRKNHGR